MNSYSPTMRAALTATLAELPDTELLSLVDDTKHKSAEGRALLAAELKRRLSPNQSKFKIMTTEKMQEAMHDVDAMLNNPALAPFIKELPTGEKVMGLDAVKGLLVAMLEAADDSMKKVLDMITEANANQ